MFGTEALASVRTLAERALPETCAITRNTPVEDAYGGETESWATAATVAARIAPTGQTPAERSIADQVQTAVTASIVLPQSADVRAGDRLVIGSRTFEVQGVVKPSLAAVQRAVSSELS